MTGNKCFSYAQELWSIHLPLNQGKPFEGPQSSLGYPPTAIFTTCSSYCGTKRWPKLLPPEKFLKGHWNILGFPQVLFCRFGKSQTNPTPPCSLSPVFPGRDKGPGSHLHLQGGTIRLTGDPTRVSLGSITVTLSHSSSLSPQPAGTCTPWPNSDWTAVSAPGRFTNPQNHRDTLRDDIFYFLRRCLQVHSKCYTFQIALSFCFVLKIFRFLKASFTLLNCRFKLSYWIQWVNHSLIHAYLSQNELCIKSCPLQDMFYTSM